VTARGQPLAVVSFCSTNCVTLLVPAVR
jgi:hypothetical protein